MVCIIGMYLIDRVAMLHCLYHLATFEVRTVPSMYCSPLYC